MVDLDERNIYFDSSKPYNKSRPVIQMDILIDALLRRPDEEYFDFLGRCEIGDYRKFRCPFDMFNSELLLKYVRKHRKWEIAGWVPEPAPEPDSAPEPEPEWEFAGPDTNLDSDDSDTQETKWKPSWLLYWEEYREEIEKPEISKDCAWGKYQFSIYEMFLMGIAFEADAETIAFVNMLNLILEANIDSSIEEWEEEVIELCSIFKYKREMTAQEKQELHQKGLDNMDAIALNLKNIIKKIVCSNRNKISGIIRNSKMDDLAEPIDEYGGCTLKKAARKELCIWTIGELEAADLLKSKNLSQEEIREMQDRLMRHHAWPYQKAHPEFYEAMKEWREKS